MSLSLSFFIGLSHQPGLYADMCMDILAAAGANPNPPFYRQDQQQPRARKPAPSTETSKPKREADSVEISDDARQAAQNRTQLLTQISQIFKDTSISSMTDRQLIRFLKEKRKEMNEFWEGDHEDRPFALALQNDLAATSQVLRNLAHPSLRRLAQQEGLI